MKKCMLLIGVMVFYLAATVSATTIEWVTEDAAFDQPWVDLLESRGYTVNASSGQYKELDETKIAALNAADLVIISRKCTSGNYTSGTEVQDWNGLTSALLSLNTHLVQQSRWGFLDAGTENGASEPLQVVDASDTIFWGVPLDEDDQVDILVSGANADVSDVGVVGNGTLLGVRPSNGHVWIAKWATGTEYYAGAGQYAGGPRAFFGAGTDGTETSALNLNLAGQQIFLNLVYEMSGASFNRQPLVDAGGDRITYVGDVLQLNGSAVDPDVVPAVTWSQVSGPGIAVFDDVSSAVTTVTFDVVGTYVLQLEADDGVTIVADTATIYVMDHADDALIAHWDFDGLVDANELIDVTGNGFDGVCYRTTGSGDPNTVPGHINGSVAAAELNGETYWEIPTAYDNADPNLTDIAAGTTIAAWVNIAETIDTNYPMIVGNGSDGWRLQVNENRWNFAYQAGGIDLRGDYPPIDGYWHHVVAVYDGVNAKVQLYVDGVLNVEEDTTSGTLLDKGTSYPLVQVGSRGDGPRIWPGLIDDIRIYNYPLSEEQIAALTSEGDVVPVLTAGEDQEVQYKGIDVQLDATLIVNDGIPNPLALSWEVTTVPAGVDMSDVVFDDNTLEDPTVSFPNVAGTYIFTLTGNDGDIEVSDEVNVVILIPTCEDIQADGLGFAADLSGPDDVPDCYVNIYDLAVMAADWLSCNNPEDAGCIWPY